MFVLKNRRHATELREANCHATLSHWKQLLKNIHPVTYYRMPSFCSLTKDVYSGMYTEKNRMTACTHIHQQRKKSS